MWQEVKNTCQKSLQNFTQWNLFPYLMSQPQAIMKTWKKGSTREMFRRVWQRRWKIFVICLFIWVWTDIWQGHCLGAGPIGFFNLVSLQIGKEKGWKKEEKESKWKKRKGQDLPQSSMSLCDIQVNIRMFHESHEVEGKETSGRCSQCKNADTVAFSTQQLQANKAFHVGFKKSWSDYRIALQRTCLFLHSGLLYCCNISKFFTLFLKSN